MSSPSVSKSVAIVTRSARFESFWRSETIFFSVGILMVFASTRLRGVDASLRQFLYRAQSLSRLHGPAARPWWYRQNYRWKLPRLCARSASFLRPGSLQYGVPICSFLPQSGARLSNLLFVQFFGQQPVQFTGIGTSPRLLHELSDEEVKCSFLALPEIFHCCGVFGKHF